LNYLLDTNVCIAIINGRPEIVRSRFQSALNESSSVFVSSVVLFELWYGVGKSAQVEKNALKVASFLGSSVQVVDFDAEDARVAGLQRVGLEKIGRLIGAYDLLIASQAVRRNWILVTANVSEFSRISDLKWQDWSRG
jgi:tRNA(fMet)-specific endonuclease VapC